MINFVCLQTRQKDTIFNIMILASEHNVNYFKLFRMITGFTLVSVLQCDLAPLTKIGLKYWKCSV